MTDTTTAIERIEYRARVTATVTVGERVLIREGAIVPLSESDAARAFVEGEIEVDFPILHDPPYVTVRDFEIVRVRIRTFTETSYEPITSL
jgi:hypothetical protein